MEETDYLSTDEIHDALSVYSGAYEREMVDAAIERREAIIPRMIEVLQALLADPTRYIEDEELFDHIYAVMLLGHLRATEAHQTIIDLFSLPDGVSVDRKTSACRLSTFMFGGSFFLLIFLDEAKSKPSAYAELQTLMR